MKSQMNELGGIGHGRHPVSIADLEREEPVLPCYEVFTDIAAREDSLFGH